MTRNFRDVILRNRNNILVRVFGVVHSPVPKCPLILPELINFQPSSFLVETTMKSLDISRFVFSEYLSQGSASMEQFCIDESEFMEAPALAASYALSDRAPITPIDINSLSTRLRLARRLLLHPVESLMLVTRYHGKSLSEVTCLEDVELWRSQFRALCPTAFSTLFTDREEYMCGRILEHAQTCQPLDRIAVLVGLSHANAIYDRLVDAASFRS